VRPFDDELKQPLRRCFERKIPGSSWNLIFQLKRESAMVREKGLEFEEPA
jgi:hypothetical protein